MKSHKHLSGVQNYCRVHVLTWWVTKCTTAQGTNAQAAEHSCLTCVGWLVGAGVSARVEACQCTSIGLSVCTHILAQNQERGQQGISMYVHAMINSTFLAISPDLVSCKQNRICHSPQEEKFENIISLGRNFQHTKTAWSSILTITCTCKVRKGLALSHAL